MRLYRHLRTCRYTAELVNRPSGISQAAAIAANRTQGVIRLVEPFNTFGVYLFVEASEGQAPMADQFINKINQIRPTLCIQLFLKCAFP